MVIVILFHVISCNSHLLQQFLCSKKQNFIIAIFDESLQMANITVCLQFL